MKKLVCAFSALGLALAAAAATKGSCEAAAAQLNVGRSATVKLVAEYNPDDKSYDSYSGVYYFATTLSRGGAYTLTSSGTNAGDVDVSGYPRATTEQEDDQEIYAPFASFSEDGEYGGVFVQYLQSDDWDAEDPASWKYFIELRGNVGDTVTVSLMSGIVEYATPGTADNPTKLTFSDKANSSTYSFVEGEYYFTASLKAGRLYRIRTTGGTAAAPVALEAGAEESDFNLIEDTVYSSDTNNTAFIVSPSENAVFSFVAHGDGATFGLVWQAIPKRTPAEHPSTLLEASNGFSASFVPGRMISSYDYADEIVDEHLCKISLAKGERWVFSTSGATAESSMVLYDSKGNTLATNQTLGNGSLDMLIGYEAKAAGFYYVGVYEPALGVDDSQPTGDEIVLVATKVERADGSPDEWDAADDYASGASPLSPMPAGSSVNPFSTSLSHGAHRLGRTDWADCFQIGARKGITYMLTTALDAGEETDLTLKAEVFTLSGSSERSVSVTGGIDVGAEDYLTFKATANATYYIRLTVSEGAGLEYPAYNVLAVAYTDDGADLGVLTVNTPGAPTATWSLGSESVKYPSGSSVLVSTNGTHTVKFSSVSGYKALVASTNVAVKAGTEPKVVEVKYVDTFDPKDDDAKGATSITVKNVDTAYARRTLWADDAEDNFAIAGADGYFYDFALRGVEGDDVVFSITNAELGVMVENAASVSQLTLPKTKAKYMLTVRNGGNASTYGGYALWGKFANVGAIKFASSKVSAKENAASVKLTVNRTAKDGYVRVKYGTVAGTAVPGKDYIAQNGVLEWASGDNKAKTVEIKLIPDLVPFYEGNKEFSVQLKAFEDDERASFEYPAAFPVGGDVCTVTLVETAKPSDTVESAYAKKAPKLATVKTETVPLESGTYYGVLEEDGSSLTNGLPKLASVTFTASTANPAALSAKVALAGKTYSFSAKGWDEGDDDGTVMKELFLVQKVNRLDEETGKSVSVVVTNTLVVTVASGATATEGDWLKAGAEAMLVMNVPDANNKGCQEEIVYRGPLYRNNAKIQDYLTAVTNFTGYYTVALAATGVSATEAPAGNGYLTLTVDNKGAVKVAGMLADGATKPSLSVAACALKADESSANGYSLHVPLYFAKSPLVFGGELRLYGSESGKVVVDSSVPLVWNNDNEKLTYYGEEGYRLLVDPVGGWYDTVVNLQAYYLTRAFEVGTADVSEFFAEALTANKATADYEYVSEAQPDGTEVSLAGDVFSTAKKSLVKSGKTYDLAASVNPCNVQVKLARATGIVSGSFSLWSKSADGASQKEITGLKHFGVLVMNREDAAPLDDAIVAAGFCTQAVKVTDVNPGTGKTSTRSWTASLPFNLVGVDQGEPDWWADDWGEQPLE